MYVKKSTTVNRMDGTTTQTLEGVEYSLEEINSLLKTSIQQSKESLCIVPFDNNILAPREEKDTSCSPYRDSPYKVSFDEYPKKETSICGRVCRGTGKILREIGGKRLTPVEKSLIKHVFIGYCFGAFGGMVNVFYLLWANGYLNF